MHNATASSVLLIGLRPRVLLVGHDPQELAVMFICCHMARRNCVHKSDLMDASSASTANDQSLAVSELFWSPSKFNDFNSAKALYPDHGAYLIGPGESATNAERGE
jgi:hypothetical protein